MERVLGQMCDRQNEREKKKKRVLLFRFIGLHVFLRGVVLVNGREGRMQSK